MAEWGKGDPRWIVEERPDGKRVDRRKFQVTTGRITSLHFSATNPNNWHWKEKNATQWSKDKLNELLVGLKVESPDFVCEIKELKKCEGEASANNRKAKLVFLVSIWRCSSRPFISWTLDHLSSTNGISKVNGKDQCELGRIARSTREVSKFRICPMRMKCTKWPLHSRRRNPKRTNWKNWWEKTANPSSDKNSVNTFACWKKNFRKVSSYQRRLPPRRPTVNLFLLHHQQVARRRNQQHRLCRHQHHRISIHEN